MKNAPATSILSVVSVVSVLAVSLLSASVVLAEERHSAPGPTAAALRKQLLTGAFTDVPERANAAFKNIAGAGSVHVISGLTGVEFHVPGKISGRPGGLSPFPVGVRKVENGVAYRQYTGELSGYFTDDQGIRWVMGPVDSSGLSHRGETFAPNAGAHPRAGLAGDFFALLVPEHGFNGALIQMEAPGDGGTFWPAAPLIWNTIDPVALLDRGYAIFTFGAGGSAPLGAAGGETVVDTNPESGSGIFWTQPADFSGLVGTIRAAFIDAHGRETAIPEPFIVTFLDPTSGLEPFSFDLGDPTLEFALPSDAFGGGNYFHLYNLPELPSDTVIFAKNLLRAVSGESAHWACWVGWSGSAQDPPMMNSGTRGGLPQGPRSAGAFIGGGDYNVWHQPRSGLRYDAFLVYAAREGQTVYWDGSDDLLPDPAFPIAAPLVWVVGDADATLPQSHAYIYANQVARALRALGRGAEINDYLRIYSLKELTHLVRDQLYSTYDDRPSDDELWYDYADVDPNPGAFNDRGRGLRVSAGMAQAMPWNGPDDAWDAFFHGAARMPRMTPLMLALLTDLRERSAYGTPLPVSRVHPNFFTDLSALATAMVPPYALASCAVANPDEGPTFAEAFACSRTITTDSELAQWPLSAHEADELRFFALHNPLRRSLEPLVVPDVAARLGTWLFDYDLIIERPYTLAQLVARYGSHRGYVDVFRDATSKLVAARLWDRRLGDAYVRDAASSSVLRGH